MKQKIKQGFTLVEMLIVLAIIGTLAVTLLVAINPSEAQRKSRDSKRLKDLATISSVIGQVMTDGLTASTCLTTGDGCSSVGHSKNQEACNSNWLSMDLCAYIATIPTDPDNDVNRTFISGAGTTSRSGLYRAKATSGEYVVTVGVESTANRRYLTTDGGQLNSWLEAGSKVSGIITTE